MSCSQKPKPLTTDRLFRPFIVLRFARIVSRTISIATLVLAFYEAMFEPPGSWSPVKFWIALFVSAIVQRSAEGGSPTVNSDSRDNGMHRYM